MEITLKVTSAKVLLTDATDLIILDIDLPTTFPEMKYAFTLRTEARYDYGVEYCRSVLKIEPEVINTRMRKL